MHAPVSGKASSAESVRPRVPADRQTRSSRECSEMTVMSAPVAHAWAHVAHTASTQGAQRGPSRPWLGLICLPPRCRARKRQTTIDVNAAPYKIFNARSPCVQLSVSRLVTVIPQHVCCTTRCSCRRAHTGAHLRWELAVAQKGRWEA